MKRKKGRAARGRRVRGGWCPRVRRSARGLFFLLALRPALALTVMLGLVNSQVLFLSSSFQPSSSRAFSDIAVLTVRSGE